MSDGRVERLKKTIAYNKQKLNHMQLKQAHLAHKIQVVKAVIATQEDDLKYMEQEEEGEA